MEWYFFLLIFGFHLTVDGRLSKSERAVDIGRLCTSVAIVGFLIERVKTYF